MIRRGQVFMLALLMLLFLIACTQQPEEEKPEMVGEEEKPEMVGEEVALAQEEEKPEMVGEEAALAQEEEKPEMEAGHILLKSADIKWTDGPPSMPPGAQIAVIKGDLKEAEPFTFRLKLPADYKIAPHTHPAIEHVTVLSGTLYMGTGDQFDPEKAVALTPGSFAVFQPGQSMFAWSEKETVIQVHGVGPWGINYVNPADDPRKK